MRLAEAIWWRCLTAAGSGFGASSAVVINVSSRRRIDHRRRYEPR